MKNNWFKKIGWVYIPVSVIGAIITLMALIFCGTVVVAADRHAHSVSDFLYSVYPYIVSTFTVLFWIASNTSEGDK